MEKSKIIEKIQKKFKLLDKDKTLLDRLLDERLDFDRISEILDFIIELKLDKSAVIGFLIYQLHKVDKASAESLQNQLTSDEKVIYSGFKSLKDMRYLTKAEEADDIRRLFIGLGKDLRVVVIKLAGILYDVKHLQTPLSKIDADFVSNVKEVFAPLAERLGLSEMKSVMEDYCFKYQNPEMYNSLIESLEKTREENEKQIEITTKRLRAILHELGIKGEIQARQKHVSSIFRKLKMKNVTLAQIYDLIAMRVLVRTVEECYSVFGKIHGIYKPIQGRVKDYISNPKPNGYQTLHTTVIVENQRPLEIQIRTYQMHKNCEYGIAAHWMYKDGTEKMAKLDKKISWFRNIMEKAQVMQPEDFVETLKTDLYTGEIFVQTPKGKVLELPVGSSVIDFAYAIHSDVGNHCVGGKINNVMRPIYTELKNGDVVEIITNPNSKGPSRDWLNHVKTSSARSKIKSFFKNEMKEENIGYGKTMFEEAAKARQFSVSQLLEEKYIQDILSKYTMQSMDELYAAMGSGSISATQAVGRFVALYLRDHEIASKKGEKIKLKTSKSGVVVDGATGLLVRYAGCCQPMSGDEIIGYISQGKGVTIHKKDCPNLKYLDPERLIDVDWEGDAKTEFYAEIKLVAEKSPNILNKITSNLSTSKVVLRKFEANESGEFLECAIVILAKSRDDVKDTCNLLSQISGVRKVSRIS